MLPPVEPSGVPVGSLHRRPDFRFGWRKNRLSIRRPVRSPPSGVNKISSQASQAVSFRAYSLDRTRSLDVLALAIIRQSRSFRNRLLLSGEFASAHSEEIQRASLADRTSFAGFLDDFYYPLCRVLRSGSTRLPCSPAFPRIIIQKLIYQ